MGAKGVSKRAPIGKRFDRLIVLSEPRPAPGNAQTVICRCECGDERDYFIGNLVRQSESMCPRCRELSRPSKGESHKHPLFNTWKGIIQRCENSAHTFFHLYGGRGVRMCERWRQDFMAFASDVGERPNGKTLDRINTDGHYEPDNVRWATQAEQMSNVRHNVYVEWQGRKLTYKQAAELAGIDRATLAWRVKVGWPIEKIMNTRSLMTANKGKSKPKRLFI